MNLKKVTIENFKCFQSKIDIDLGKITILTGANSSGKSSIIYGILGAIQSGEFPIQFSPNGKYVNMGNFKEVVFNHKNKGSIKLGFTFLNGIMYQIDTIWKEDPRNSLPKLRELKAKSEFFTLSIKYVKQNFLIDLEYNSEKNPQYKKISPENFEKLLINLFDKLESSDKKIKA
jgi:predicted ATP-dependent endonuclease of OLD family